MGQVPITPRNIKFALSGEDKRNWFAGDPVRTAIMDGASILFPYGEGKFIESVIHFRDRITDPKLLADINAFAAQEGVHSREHRRYNKAIEAFGGDIARLEKRLRDVIEKMEARGVSPEYKLALTCAFEHFTAMLAHELLADPHFLDGAEPEFARLWRWHAIEEAEHKAVAFDVWNQVGPKGLRGWLMRVRAMLKATQIFTSQTRFNTHVLLRARGQTNFLRNARRILHFAVIRPGLLRRSFGVYLSYFRPGFHPWQHDDRHLIELHKNSYAAEPVIAAE